MTHEIKKADLGLCAIKSGINWYYLANSGSKNVIFKE